MRKRIALTATILAAVFLSACGTVRIARINADPSRYRNRDVRVEGNVTNSFGALGTGGYQVSDGTGSIYVLSTGSGVPSKGSRVQVTGTVMNGATVMGRSYGTAIREYHHKVRNN
jgi:hypothetical protein